MQKTFLIFCFVALIICAHGQDIKPDTTNIPPSTPADAQQKPSKKDQRPFFDRISLGGNTGFWIQPSTTYLEISALLAYRFPKILTVGPGYRYIYTRNRVYGKDMDSYGPNIFARAQLTKRIYLWSEFEWLKTEYTIQVANNTIETRTDHIESAFLGAGYIRSFGKKGRGGLSFQLLYNLRYIREEYAPYYSPVIYRVGYFF